MTDMWEILVPTMFNDGKPITTRYHRVWDQKVRKLTGGLTICPVAKGQWVSDGQQLFKERMIPVRILTDQKTMEEIVVMSLDYYEQLKMFYYKVSSHVVIAPASREMMESWPVKNKAGTDYGWLEPELDGGIDAEER